MGASEQADLLRSLIAALRRAFAARAGADEAAEAELGHVERLLARAPDTSTVLQPTNHPLIGHLPAVLDLATTSASDIAAALRPIAARLPWRYGYPPRSDAPGLEGAMGWAELIGPLAPVVSHEVCFGLTLIGPLTYYPPHRHPAVELYRIVAGHPQWTVATDTAPRRPGDAILHPSNVVHAMQTDEQPLLAIYSWTGDVDTPSAWA